MKYVITFYMSHLKIAYFTDTFYPQINGVVSSVINLSKTLADRGHEIFILAPTLDKEFEEFQYPGITVLRIASIKASFYEDFRWSKIMSLKIFSVLKKAQIDIIHFETPVNLGIMAINMARLLNKPLVGTYHTFVSDPRYIKHFKLLRPGPIIQNLSWFYTNQFYNRADLTTAPSLSTIEEMKENGCNAPQMKTISNGIDPSVFDQREEKNIREKYGLEGKTVLYVGRVSHEKGIEVLLEGFFHAASKDKTIKLMIVGGGPQYEEILNLVQESAYSDRIIVTGPIPHDELISSAIYHSCEVFSTASETENQPMTILEAQVNGCVCVGVDARGVPGMIVNEESGIIVQPGDSVALGEAYLQILNNRELLQSMKEKTLEQVKDHFLGRVADRWEQEYITLKENFQGRKSRDRLFLPKRKQELKE